MNIHEHPPFVDHFQGKPWETDGFPCGFPQSSRPSGRGSRKVWPGARWGNAAASGAALFPCSATGRDSGSLGDVDVLEMIMWFQYVSIPFNPLGPCSFLGSVIWMGDGIIQLTEHSATVIAAFDSLKKCDDTAGMRKQICRVSWLYQLCWQCWVYGKSSLSEVYGSSRVNEQFGGASGAGRVGDCLKMLNQMSWNGGS